MTKRTKLTVRQIRAINTFLRKLAKDTTNAELAHLYESAMIKPGGHIGHTVLKGYNSINKGNLVQVSA